MGTFVDQRIYDTTKPTSPIVRITVWSGDAEPWIEEIPFSKLNEF